MIVYLKERARIFAEPGPHDVAPEEADRLRTLGLLAKPKKIVKIADPEPETPTPDADQRDSDADPDQEQTEKPKTTRRRTKKTEEEASE